MNIPSFLLLFRLHKEVTTIQISNLLQTAEHIGKELAGHLINETFSI